MKSVKQFFIDFYKDEEGLTAVEYAAAGAIVAAGVATAFGTLDDAIDAAIGEIETALS